MATKYPSLPPSLPPPLSLQDVCMPAMRAQASAVYIGIITIVASAGPVIVSLCKNDM